MKKLLLERVLGLCLMLAVFTNGAWASKDAGTTFEELALGDWFVLKQTKPYFKEGYEFSTTWKGTVINRNKQELTVEFVLTHFFEQQTVYYSSGGIIGDSIKYYIDTYFGFAGKENQKLVLDPPRITMTRSLTMGENPNIKIKLSDSIREYYLNSYLDGLVNNKKNILSQSRSAKLAINELANEIKSVFEQNELVSVPDIALTNASFKLPPNTVIYYKLEEKEQKTPPQMYRNDEYDNIEYFKKESNNTYSISFHLDKPTKMVVEGCNLWLSPSDSLVITKNKKGEVSFSGKGAEICVVANEVMPSIYEIRNNMNSRDFNMDQISNSIEEIERLYEDKLYTNKSKIDLYWYKSAKLSLDYIQSTVLFGTIFKMNKIDNWSASSFENLCPIIDYRYQPEFYDNFMKAFYRDTQKALNNKTLTDKAYWAPDRGSFYLVNQLFYGYPRAFLLLENLEQRLKDESLSNLKEETSIFYKYCFEPELKNKLKKLETHYRKLENGENIKDLGIDVLKQLSLKKKADAYLLLNVSPLILDYEKTIFSKIDLLLIEGNLKKEVEWVNIRAEDMKTHLTEEELREKEPFGYMWLESNKCSNTFYDLGFAFETLLILRNDGTIIGRVTLARSGTEKEIEEIILKDKEECAQAPLFSRNQLYGALGVLVVVILIVGVYYNNRIRKQKLQTRFSQLKLKAIRSQMNPHFIFNALTSIQSLILRSDTERANDYLTTFSYMLRNVLTSSEKTLISLSDELELVEQYLQIEQLRMAIDYQLEVANDICTDEVEIPGMLLQPIVENAVIHGLFPQHGGKIDIHLWTENNSLWCEIVDNGVGIKKSSDNKSKFGLYSIEERLTLLNHSKASQLKLSVVNRSDEEQASGCRVKIMIPL